MLFLQTGQWLSEVTGLTLSDIELPTRITRDPDNVGLVGVWRNEAKEAYQPLHWKVCEAVKVWLLERKRLAEQKYTTTEAVFLSEYGQRLSGRTVQRLVKKHVTRAGIMGHRYEVCSIPVPLINWQEEEISVLFKKCWGMRAWRRHRYMSSSQKRFIAGWCSSLRCRESNKHRSRTFG